MNEKRYRKRTRRGLLGAMMFAVLASVGSYGLADDCGKGKGSSGNGLDSPQIGDMHIAGGLPKGLDRYIASGMKAWKIPGLSIAVVKDGQVVLLKGYGVLEAGGAEQVDADTIFAIGSTSKAFTAAAIGTLVDNKKLKWDDRVIEHWPEFRMSDPWVTKEIRVSDLLANHSGLNTVAEEIWYGTGYDREELIERLAEVPVSQGFRYQFQYRNLMFLAAGQLIPRVTGMSWDEYVTETLFKPLDMGSTTTWLAEAESEKNLARPHMIDYQGRQIPIPYRNIEHVGPAGSILSTARDMANWLQMWLAGEILEPETLAFIVRSQTPLTTVGPGGEPLEPPAELRAYALSWVTESYGGTRLVWHNGSIDGMSAWVGMAPGLNLGVAILSNLEDANLRNAIFYRIIESYTDTALTDLNPGLLKKHRKKLKERKQSEKRWLKLKAKPGTCAHSLADYAGTYRNPAFGVVHIDVENGQLVYQRTPSMILDLVCEKDDTFRGRYRGEVEDLAIGKVGIVFQSNNDGKIDGFSEGEIIFQAY